MKRTCVAALIAVLLVPVCATAADPAKEEWIPLFNGKNLDGWVPKITGFEVGDNHADTFRTEDGVLKVSYDRYDGDFDRRFRHLFHESAIQTVQDSTGG